MLGVVLRSWIANAANAANAIQEGVAPGESRSSKVLGVVLRSWIAFAHGDGGGLRAPRLVGPLWGDCCAHSGAGVVGVCSGDLLIRSGGLRWSLETALVSVALVSRGLQQLGVGAGRVEEWAQGRRPRKMTCWAPLPRRAGTRLRVTRKPADFRRRS